MFSNGVLFQRVEIAASIRGGRIRIDAWSENCLVTTPAARPSVSFVEFLMVATAVHGKIRVSPIFDTHVERANRARQFCDWFS